MHFKSIQVSRCVAALQRSVCISQVGMRSRNARLRFKLFARFSSLYREPNAAAARRRGRRTRPCSYSELIINPEKPSTPRCNIRVRNPPGTKPIHPQPRYVSNPVRLTRETHTRTTTVNKITKPLYLPSYRPHVAATAGSADESRHQREAVVTAGR
ncbi:hypothetical protein EVAR_38956_1 [Eumeta japonica]|uniref:Uncharacterized protein n=1 Tax=Eumeta variegata TaxID=151549 RepID=A0A4C1WB32_EUMVA|nr:hypothetical protein EVAR_38956_1 [Eumeta japonica]